MKLLICFFILLVTSSNVYAQPATPTAEEILAPAYKQAKKENKNVFILFHASWCGWCRKMDASMHDPLVKNYFTDNYVIVHLTVEETANNKKQENAGAFDIKTKYHGATSGLPFWLIMDKKRNLLADSQVRPEGTALTAPGSNIGCPAGKNEVKHFIEVLRKTSQLDDKALTIISEVFSKNIIQ